MKKTAWKNRISTACRNAGTYKEEFDSIIESLAEILEQRDAAMDQFKSLGGKPVIEHTNNGGTTNLAKNPALILWDDLNKTALTYWRDLGLTPKGYHALMGDTSFKKEKKSGLAEALEKYGV